jgi:hypothetical protein
MVLAVAAAVAAERFWGESGVEPKYFAIIAQVIPILVLAYLLETRGRAASLLDTKEMLQATYRYAAVTRRIAHGNQDSLSTDFLSESVDSPNPEILDHTEEIASLDTTVSLVKTSNVITAIAAGLGELVALFALADGSTDVVLSSVTFGIVIFLGVSLVVANSVAMESLALRAAAYVHRRRAEEVREELVSLRAKVDVLQAKLQASVAEADRLAKSIRQVPLEPDEPK